MLPPGLRSPREVVLYYEELYFSLVENGTVYPCIYPWVSAGVAIVLAYLLVDHRNSPLLKASRWPIFVTSTAFHIWCMLNMQARSAAAAFGLGLMCAWGILWIFAITIAYDCQSHFKRYERSVEDSNIEPIDGAIHKHSNGFAISNGQPTELRKRAGLVRDETSDQKQFTPSKRQRVFWQSYPSSFSIERLDWVLDVFTNFRGVGWTYETNGVPPPPHSVQVDLGMASASKQDAGNKLTSKTGIRRYSNHDELLKHVAIGIAYGYFALDAIKTIMHHDPYFWGYIDAAAPHWLPGFVRQSYHLTKMYRMLLSLYAIYTALWYIFKLGPAFFCGILGPKRVGIRGEAWMNPYDMFGAYSNVLDKGLAGWWGGWWHQIFRFGFEAPANRLLELFGIEKRSSLGKLISLLVAFFLSGCLHACGSFTQLGDTRPLKGPMCFFLLQALGIVGQIATVQLLKKAGIAALCPIWLSRCLNFFLVNTWLYYTAPLLVDDFARGGVWLFEPVPFSPLRGLGLGQPDDKWYCFEHQRIWWRTGHYWWDTGIAP
ncbi:hypothetical protein D0864_07965 [Hortaea werneckii]|uniref:Wax synthase domain-containing protein n=1 Tax=Hortaea werneckii TaxID=91943 RepID=A0A3M7F276_HORWE|nr:hypothetical protein D0864_07965 [Hortaea werneckii]